MLANVHPQCINLLYSACTKHIVKCRQNFCRFISSEQKRNLCRPTDFSQPFEPCKLSAIYRLCFVGNTPVSSLKRHLSLLKTNDIRHCTSLPLLLPRFANISDIGSTVGLYCQIACRYVSNGSVESASKSIDFKTLSSILSSFRDIFIDNNIIVEPCETDCSDFTNREDSSKDKSTEKSILQLVNQQTVGFMQNFGDVCFQNNVINKRNLKRKKSGKHKLMLLLAGGCLSCKKAKKDDSFDKSDSISNQEHPESSVVTASTSSVNTKTIKSVVGVIEKECQLSKSDFTSGNGSQANLVTTNEYSNEALLNAPSFLENADEKFPCEVNANDETKLLSDMQKESLDELPYSSSVLPDATFPNTDNRPKKRFHEKGAQKKNLKRKKKDTTDTGEKKTRKRPNYFVAIQVLNPQIIAAVKEVQNHIIHGEPRLKSALIKPSTLHVTILVCHISDDFEKERACKALEASYDILKEGLIAEPLAMTFQGLGNFNNKVIFVKLAEDNAVERLNDIAYHVKSCYEEHGIDLENGKSLTPHLTLFKTSKDPKLWKKGVKKIEPSLYENYKNATFGTQVIKGLQFLSMLAEKDANGYYFCEKELLFCTPNSKEGENSQCENLNSTVRKEKEAIRKKISALAFKQLNQHPSCKYKTPKKDVSDKICKPPMEEGE